jgi:hypothetical protein
MKRNPLTETYGNLKKAIKIYFETPESYIDIATWNISSTTDMSHLFEGIIDTPEKNELLNGITRWNMSRVKNTSYMFFGCLHFNQPLNWNMSNVENMESMFSGCANFDQTLPWNVSNVTTMGSMFSGCTNFNQPLPWNVSRVSNMRSMFFGCENFNQQLEWDVSNVINFNLMFKNCYNFNQDLSGWRLNETITQENVRSMFDEAVKMLDHPEHWPTLTATEESTLSTNRVPFEIDFIPFMDFVNEECRDSNDIFCNLREMLNLEYFTSRAPLGYSLNDVPLKHINQEKPFYSAIKYLFSIIPHFAPSIVNYPNRCTEHSYMIVLNRLIYYYNIYTLLSNNELSGFSNTAGVYISTHGVYDEYSKKNMKNIPRKMDNLFHCLKSSPGCVTYELNISHYISNKHSPPTMMVADLESKGYINFDKDVFEFKHSFVDNYDPVQLDNLKANCYIEDSKRGRAMNHRISPNTKKYVDKHYYGSQSDHTCYIIDLELLSEISKQTRDVKRRLDYSNLYLKPEFSRGVYILGGKITNASTNLSKILEYYSNVRNKKNIFVYDAACGVENEPDPASIVPKTIDFSISEGLGIKRKKNKSKRKVRKTKTKRRRITKRKRKTIKY